MRHRSSLLPPEVDSPLDASVFEGLYRHYLGRHLDRFTDADDLGRAFVEDAPKKTTDARRRFVRCEPGSHTEEDR